MSESLNVAGQALVDAIGGGDAATIRAIALVLAIQTEARAAAIADVESLVRRARWSTTADSISRTALLSAIASLSPQEVEAP